VARRAPPAPDTANQRTGAMGFTGHIARPIPEHDGGPTRDTETEEQAAAAT